MRSAPDDEMLRGWFAEGYCFAYSRDEMESLRSESTPGRGTTQSRFPAGSTVNDEP